MTITGALLIPLGLLLLFMPWRFMFMALPSFALLHGAAVMNVGSVGLQPGYALALLMIMRTGLEILLLRQPLNRDALTLVAPLGVLVAISVLVLWISVAFFTGKVIVIGGTDLYVLENARPYVFRRENIAQISYLLINTLLVYALAHQSAKLVPRQLLIVVDKGVIAAALLALAVCGWQLLAQVTGIYFPNDFLFSNAGYIRADNQAFFGSLRLNGPFSEPSALAYYFSGFILYFWKRLRLQPSLLSMALVIGLTGAVFLAYSTTGYIVLAIFMGIVAFDLVPPMRRRIRILRLNWRRAAIAGVLLLTIGSATIWVMHDWDRLSPILNVSLFEKNKTSSFAERSGAEAMAIEIIGQTGGIGIGLGSHKPNSLMLTLLSNVGVAGTAAFLFFMVLLLRPAEARPVTGAKAVTLDETPLRYFVIGLLLVHAVSNANFNVVMFWTTCGLLAGFHASIRRAARRSANAVLLTPAAWSAASQPASASIAQRALPLSRNLTPSRAD